MMRPDDTTVEAVKKLGGDNRWDVFHKYLLDCFNNSKEVLVSSNEENFREAQGQSRALKELLSMIRHCQEKEQHKG